MKITKLITTALFLFAYLYCFFLCMWGKPLYGETGHIEYIIILQVLAIVNYFNFHVVLDTLRIGTLKGKNEAFFLLHGALIAALPYNDYMLSGCIIMGAALIAIKK